VFDDPRRAATVVSIFISVCVEGCCLFAVDDTCESPLECECDNDLSASTALELDVVEADEEGLGVLDCDDDPR
jgi:hypothetical protein